MYSAICQHRLRLALLAALIWPVAASAHRSSSSSLVRTTQVDLAVDVLGVDSKELPLVAVNGGPGLTHAYMVRNATWDRLARNRPIVFYDQRGTGRSTRMIAGAPQTMQAQIADLEAIRLSLHTEQIDLLGDSFGGLIALAYTLAHPDRVHRLIVSDGLPSPKHRIHPMPEFFPDLDAEEALRSKTLPKEEAALARLRSHFRKCFYSSEAADRYLSGFDDFGFNATVNADLGSATQDVDLTPQLSRIKLPVLILTGRFDVNVAPITAWRMAKAMPDATLHIFEHSGHLPSYEEPDEYVTQVETFLSK